MISSDPLLKYFPKLDSYISNINLGTFPTPVQKLSNLSKFFNCQMYIKRDDISGNELGGNKIRKLEYLFGDIIKSGKSDILSYGACYSNFIAIFTYYAHKLGYNVHNILFPQPDTNYKDENQFLINSFSKSITNIISPILLPFSIAKFKIFHPNSYLSPMGGTNTITSLGYVNAGLELAEQIKNGEIPEPDYIFLPFGTGGTIAGLIVGLQIANLHPKVFGIRVVDKIISNRIVLMKLIYSIKRFLLKINPETIFNKLEYYIINDYYGKGYAIPTLESEYARRLFIEKENVLLDTTYSGKACSAMINMIENNSDKNKCFLFWNTFNSLKLSI